MSSSIPSRQILTARAQPFRGARDLAFCLKVPFDSLLVWASREGSGETARMRRLAWTFAARIGDKYQIRLTWSICCRYSSEPPSNEYPQPCFYGEIMKIIIKLSSNTLLICFTEFWDNLWGLLMKTNILKEFNKCSIPHIPLWAEPGCLINLELKAFLDLWLAFL